MAKSGRPTAALVLARVKYMQQKYHAKKRGIGFGLTFDEWLDIWTSSGHFAERGRKLGQYVMARFGDKGGYYAGNVEIITVSKNHYDGTIGKSHPVTDEQRHKQREVMTGRILTEDHKRAIGNGVRGKTKGVHKSDEHRRKLSIAKKGKSPPPFSDEHKEKLRQASLRTWAKRRAQSGK